MAGTFDRRRIAGPEVSYPPIFEPLDGAPGASAQAGPSRRIDRRDDEARPTYLKTGLVSQANGSGYIESGGVKIACSVYGPRPKLPPYSPQGSLNLEIKFAPFASHPRRAPLRDTEPTPLSNLLTQLLLPTLQLHLLPKSTLDVHLLILESDSLTSLLAAGLTVASAAVADAGIPMNALGVGGVVDQIGDQQEKGGRMVLDPEAAEEEERTGGVVVGVMPARGKVSGLWLEGEVEVEDAIEMIEMAVKSSKTTHAILGQALIEGAEERERSQQE